MVRAILTLVLATMALAACTRAAPDPADAAEPGPPILGRVIAQVTGTSTAQVVVYFDGEEVGTGTSQQRRPAGPVRVTASLLAHECWATPEQLDVVAADTVRTVVTCMPDDFAIHDDAGTKRRPPPPQMVYKGDCALDPEGTPEGMVTIDTDPFTEIFWGAKRLGETPLSRVKLPAGCIELLVRGGDPVRERTIRIRVEPSKKMRYRFEF